MVLAMIKTIKSILFVVSISFLALGFSSSAMADSEQERAGLIKDIFSVDTDFENDAAQKWIKQLFGSFIFTDATTGSTTGSRGDSSDVTILTEAIGFSNVLAMIFGVVIVSYLFIAGSLNTAHHGEILGKNWSSVWLPARLALGFGLIMPAGSFGGGAISTIQALCIWMILVGSNAANVLWSQLTDKVSSGASVNSNIMIPVTVPKQIVEILSCRISYMNETGDNDVFTVIQDGLNNTVKAGNANEKFTLKEIPSYKKGMYEIDFEECGSITLNTPSWSMNSDDDDSSNKVFPFLTEASAKGKEKANEKLIDYVNELVPLVNQYYTDLGGAEAVSLTTVAPDDPARAEILTAKNQIAERLFLSGVKISTQIPQDIKSSVVTGNFQSEFKEELKKGGWGTAGLWFMRVGSVQNLIGEIVSPIAESVKPEVPDICIMRAIYCKDETEKKNARVANDILLASSMFSEGAKLYSRKVTGTSSGNSIDPAGFIDLRGEAARQASNNAVICDGNNCSISGNDQTSSVNLARSILHFLSPVDDEVKISGSSSVTDTTGVASPFATAASIGNMSINVMQGMMAAALGGSVISAVAGNTPAGKIGKSVLGKVGEGIISGAATIAMAIAGYFGAIGITLAFVIPFMPAMLWMMMMVGYLLLVIEAMIATPFAVIMMVTPEGEGISGHRLEKAIGLIALVVLRPSLMIMGLIAAITLSSVSFSIYNQFFWYTASTAITGSMFTILVIIGMYTTGLFQICKYSITVMSKLPDHILDWMNFNGNRAFADDASAGVDQGVKGGVEATKGMVQSITSDIKQRMRRPIKPSG